MITAEIIEKYGKIRKLAEAGGTPGERAAAQARLDSMRTSYPGIDAAFAAASGPASGPAFDPYPEPPPGKVRYVDPSTGRPVPPANDWFSYIEQAVNGFTHLQGKFAAFDKATSAASTSVRVLQGPPRMSATVTVPAEALAYALEQCEGPDDLRTVATLLGQKLADEITRYIEARSG